MSLLPQKCIFEKIDCSNINQVYSFTLEEVVTHIDIYLRGGTGKSIRFKNAEKEWKVSLSSHMIPSPPLGEYLIYITANRNVNLPMTEIKVTIPSLDFEPSDMSAPKFTSWFESCTVSFKNCIRDIPFHSTVIEFCEIGKDPTVNDIYVIENVSYRLWIDPICVPGREYSCRWRIKNSHGTSCWSNPLKIVPDKDFDIGFNIETPDPHVTLVLPFSFLNPEKQIKLYLSIDGGSAFQELNWFLREKYVGPNSPCRITSKEYVPPNQDFQVKLVIGEKFEYFRNGNWKCSEVIRQVWNWGSPWEFTEIDYREFGISDLGLLRIHADGTVFYEEASWRSDWYAGDYAELQSRTQKVVGIKEICTNVYHVVDHIGDCVIRLERMVLDGEKVWKARHKNLEYSSKQNFLFHQDWRVAFYYSGFNQSSFDTSFRFDF